MKQRTLPGYYSADPTFPTPNAPEEPHHRPSLPAGGFKSSDGDGVALASPTFSEGTGPSFPDGPTFTSFPVQPKLTRPGFRGVVAEDNDAASTENETTLANAPDPAFPVPDMGHLNPYAAYMLLHANDSFSGDESGRNSPRMPHPSDHQTSHASLSSPVMPSHPPLIDTSPSMPQAPGNNHSKASPNSPIMPGALKSPVEVLTSKVAGVTLKDEGPVSKSDNKSTSKDAGAPKMPQIPSTSEMPSASLDKAK